MHVLVLYSSPNKDGLTAACAAAAVEGVHLAGGSAESICINDLRIGVCQACLELDGKGGWGTCRRLHHCQVLDDFQALHARILQADALALITPVYWGDLSESLKALTDRLRRCEAPRRAESGLAGKPVLCVAAAGGSGNGQVTCLLNMERWVQHVQARLFDPIGVNRWSRPYKLEAIRAAAQAMASGAMPT